MGWLSPESIPKTHVREGARRSRNPSFASKASIARAM